MTFEIKIHTHTNATLNSHVLKTRTNLESRLRLSKIHLIFLKTALFSGCLTHVGNGRGPCLLQLPALLPAAYNTESVTKIDFNLRSKFCFKLYCSVFFLTDTINIVFLFINIIAYRYGCSFLLNLIVILFSLLNIAHIKVYKNSSYKWCFISDELTFNVKLAKKL